jgi:hypothetical protein
VLARFVSRTWPETETFSTRTAREPRKRPSFLFWEQTEKEEWMVKQRFLVLFRRWLFTAGKVFGPILLFEGFVQVRQYLQYAPLGMLDVLMGALFALLVTAMLCLVWAWGEWCWSKLRRVRGFVSELWQCSRSYWNPEAIKTTKA